MNTWVIARSTFGEAIRKRIGLYVLFTTLIFLILSQLFASLSVQSSIASQTAQSGSVEVKVIKSMAYGIIVLGGLVLSIFLSFDLIPSDVDKKTIYTILSKPVWRWQYVLGKFFGTAMALGVNIGMMGIALVILVWAKSGLFQAPLLAGVFLLYLQFVLLAGLSILLSLVVTRNINVAACFGVYVMGMVSEFWQDIAKTTPSPAIQWLAKGLHLAIPNLYNFNVTNSLINYQQWSQINNPWQDVALVAVYGLLWCVAVMVVATSIFSRKEV